MTHETKVGIVVACSFLGLVGVVLTLKMKEGSNPAAASDAAEVPAWGEPTPIATAATATTPLPASIPAPAAVTSAVVQPTFSVPPNPLPRDILLAGGSSDTRSVPGGSGTGTPNIVPPASTMGERGTPATTHEHELVGPPPPPPGWDLITPTEPSSSVTQPRGGVTEPAAAHDPAAGLQTPAGTSPETWPRDDRLVMPPPPGMASTPPATASGATPGAGAVGTGSSSAAVPGPPSPTGMPVDTGAAPSVTIGPPEINPSPGSQPGVMPVRLVPTPPAADTMPEGSSRPAGAGSPALSPAAVAAAPTGGLPPLGAPTQAVTPAITPALPLPGQPKVDSYDVETCHCKAGDTFATLAQQYYHNPKYEKALLMFNRSYPMAADSLKADSPTLQPNQPIYIPPAKILENRYSNLIPDHTPLPAPAGTSPNSAAPAPIPTPVPAGAPVTAHSSPPAPRSYQVQNRDGEMMYRIAEQQLGNGNRWMEIRDLNPTWRPEQPVPAGTVLRLPAQ